MKFSIAIFATALAATSNALSPANKDASVSRRGALNGLLSAGAAAALVVGGPQIASATAAKTGAASPFQGDYDDPNHPSCLRQVKVVGAPLRADGSRSQYPVIEVTGYDGKGSGATCTDRPTRADLWKVTGTVKSKDTAVIDFSPKGGPKDLLAKFENDGIVFPDGNKWTKVPRGTNSRRPEDMSTLKSE